MRYVVETAQPGDGALALLGRYRLDRDPCNLEEFYRINKIKKNQGLQVDVQYKLPIRIFTFNQKSIMGTVGIQDEATALRIDDYNHKMYIRGIKPGRYQSDRQLWVPHGLLHCKPTVLKAPAQREYAFLGKKHQKIVLKDNQLAGAVYYLIPGHGGPDPGAVGKVGKNILCEDEYAYDVTLRDVIPASIASPALTSVVDTSGVVTAANFSLTGNTLTTTGTGFDLPKEPTTRTITLIVTGTLAGPVTANQQIKNINEIKWTSLSGSPGQITTNNPNAYERTGSGSKTLGELNNYVTTGSATFTVNTADLAVVKTVSNPTPNVGDTITFTVTV
jgi:hypothetical protein